MSDGPILIVEDDVDIREILAEALEDKGFDVMTAANGLEALSVLGAAPALPSVILLDLMMPVMDGYAFLEERWKNIALRSIPIALFTAGRNVDGTRLGNGIAIVPKPINLAVLVDTLQKLRSSESVQYDH